MARAYNTNGLSCLSYGITPTQFLPRLWIQKAKLEPQLSVFQYVFLRTMHIYSTIEMSILPIILRYNVLFTSVQGFLEIRSTAYTLLGRMDMDTLSMITTPALLLRMNTHPYKYLNYLNTTLNTTIFSPTQ